MTLDLLETRIRDVPDFPKPGIMFKDITPLLSHPKSFGACIELLADAVRPHDVQGIVAVESRGFLFGAPLALALGVPLELVRKPGKLPYKKNSVSYELEYGSDRVEMHVDAVTPGRRYAIIDDLIATGGTAGAAAELVELQKGVVACLAFVIELDFLEGRKRLGQRPVVSLLHY